MIGGIFIGEDGRVALGLVKEPRNVTAVALYTESLMLSVTTADGAETFMAHEINSDMVEMMRVNSVIHIGHVCEDESVEREYPVPLAIVD